MGRSFEGGVHCFKKNVLVKKSKVLVLYNIILTAWPSIKQNFVGTMCITSVLDSLIFFPIWVRLTFAVFNLAMSVVLFSYASIIFLRWDYF